MSWSCAMHQQPSSVTRQKGFTSVLLCLLDCCSVKLLKLILKFHSPASSAQVGKSTSVLYFVSNQYNVGKKCNINYYVWYVVSISFKLCKNPYNFSPQSSLLVIVQGLAQWQRVSPYKYRPFFGQNPKEHFGDCIGFESSIVTSFGFLIAWQFLTAFCKHKFIQWAQCTLMEDGCSFLSLLLLLKGVSSC